MSRRTVEHAEVLAPEGRDAAAVRVVAQSPEAVSAQYRRAVGGCLEMVRFGGMLLEVEADLERPATRSRTGGWTKAEGTLKGWLEENCPEIGYHTAMRFRRLAEGLRSHCMIPANVPLGLCMPGADGEAVEPDAEALAALRIKPGRLAKWQRDVWALVDGRSARQLMFDFTAADGSTKTGGDRRSGETMTEEEKHVRALERARHLWLGHLDDLMGDSRHVGSLLLLEADVLDAILLKIETIKDAVKTAKAR
jgi:hypothetical protein